VSKTALRRFIMAGAVRVDGRPYRRPGMPVRAGARIQVRLRAEAVRRGGVPGDVAASLGDDRILFEDDVLIAIDKPPGLPTQPTVDPGRPSLYGLVKALLAGRSGSGDAYLGLHQRLDRDTSGVVLFSKTREVNPALARLFAERRIEKTYRALVVRPSRLPARTWSADGGVDGAAARTEFRLLEVLPEKLVVEARPITGRKHQIRVHLASAGLPILGDAVHGGRAAAVRAPRLMLHAIRVALPHPVSGQPLVVESPLPEDFRSLAVRDRGTIARRGSGG
jgi:23S rRNA pseudouridine1911/1915/1917 synthase